MEVLKHTLTETRSALRSVAEECLAFEKEVNHRKRNEIALQNLINSQVEIMLSQNQTIQAFYETVLALNTDSTQLGGEGDSESLTSSSLLDSITLSLATSPLSPQFISSTFRQIDTIVRTLHRSLSSRARQEMPETCSTRQSLLPRLETTLRTIANTVRSSDRTIPEEMVSIKRELNTLGDRELVISQLEEEVNILRQELTIPRFTDRTAESAGRVALGVSVQDDADIISTGQLDHDAARRDAAEARRALLSAQKSASEAIKRAEQAEAARSLSEDLAARLSTDLEAARRTLSEKASALSLVESELSEWPGQQSRMENEISELKEQCQTLERDIRLREAGIRQRDESNRIISDRVALLESESSRRAVELTARNGRLGECEARLSLAQEECLRLTGELARERERSESVGRLRGDLERACSEVDESKLKLGDCISKRDDIAAECDRIRLQLEAETKRAADLSLQLTTVRSKLDQAISDLDQVTSERDNLLVNIKEAKTASDAYNEDRDAELEVVMAKVTELEQKNLDLGASHRAEMDAVETRALTAEDVVASLTADVNRLQSELDASAQKCIDMEASASSNSSLTLKRLQACETELQEHQQASGAIAAALRSQIQSYCEENEALTLQLQAMSDSLAACECKLQECADRESSMQEQPSVEEQLPQVSIDSIVPLLKALGVIEDVCDITDMSNHITHAISVVDAQRNSCTELRASVSQLRDHLEETEAELDDEAMQHEECTRALEAALSKASIFEAQLVELRAKIVELECGMPATASTAPAAVDDEGEASVQVDVDVDVDIDIDVAEDEDNEPTTELVIDLDEDTSTADAAVNINDLKPTHTDKSQSQLIASLNSEIAALRAQVEELEPLREISARLRVILADTSTALQRQMEDIQRLKHTGAERERESQALRSECAMLKGALRKASRLLGEDIVLAQKEVERQSSKLGSMRGSLDSIQSSLELVMEQSRSGRGATSKVARSSHSHTHRRR
eukprot:gnl/Dysnectes_brevis/4214_a5569_424.p1 GENE.gnl/Dysnectes_brevis/4214_a5569_424~~gnl/Dysnectes_brevis/4214_a5569_424.p1  ORF type:complete len:987 (-),score=239.90 gnl/Dysnectes_brevis/4214_a5569_424:63-3023(-)